MEALWGKQLPRARVIAPVTWSLNRHNGEIREDVALNYKGGEKRQQHGIMWVHVLLQQALMVHKQPLNQSALKDK